MTHQFNGFSPESFQFLTELKNNNNKPWFEAHRQDYETHLLGPMRGLVSALSDFMKNIDEDFEVRPAVNKAISRIFRDVRFSKDKSPFRSNMWIVFKRPIRNWQDSAGYFFELFPNWYRYGMGFYTASRSTMDRFRAVIDDDPDAFMKTVAFLENDAPFTFHGEHYKRTLKSNHPPEVQAWYQCKTFYVSCDRPVEDRLFSPELASNLIRDFQVTVPLYQLLKELTYRSE